MGIYSGSDQEKVSPMEIEITAKKGFRLWMEPVMHIFGVLITDYLVCSWGHLCYITCKTKTMRRKL